MLSGSNDIELLIRATIASLKLNGDEVFSEIVCKRINRQTLSVGRFEGCGGKGAGGCVVADIGFCGGFRI